MIVGKITGKPVHHDNCTYCQWRLVIKSKKGRRKSEIEKCMLSGVIIPPPMGDRYCSEYTQEQCDCEQCEELRKKYDRSTLHKVPENTEVDNQGNYSKGARRVHEGQKSNDARQKRLLPD